jgi:hypothetical protein
MQNRSRCVVVAVMMLVGCGDDGGAPAPDAPAAELCPAQKPDDGTTCTLPTDSTPMCAYLIERCECGPTDIEWTCACGSDRTWSCDRGYDCYPCD